MALDDLLISTGVDNLIKLVHERGRIELGEAADEMKLSRVTVEDWAHVLEGEGIIKIEYRLTKMFLVWASMKPEEFQKAAKGVSSKKSETEDKIEGLIATVEKSTSDLKDLDADMRVMKKKSEVSMESLENEGREILSMANDIDRMVAEKEKRLNMFRKELSSLKSEMDTLAEGQKKSAAPRKGKEDASAQIEMLQKAEEKLERQLREFNEMYSDVDAKIGAMTESLSKDRTMDELSSMKSSIADLQFAKGEILKSVEGLNEEAKQVGDEVEKLSRRVREIELKKVSTANPKKLLAQLDETAYAARQERDTTLAELQKSLEMVRKQLQAYSQLQYQYQTLNARVASLQSSYSRETEEVEQFVVALDSAYKKYSKDMENLSSALDEQKRKYGEIQQRAKGIEVVLGQLDILKQEGDSLAIKLKGVLKEAQVVSMKSPNAAAVTAGGKSSHVPQAAPQLPEELVQRINLTAQEEAEFERKREELRGLIRKMWEDDRGSKSG